MQNLNWQILAAILLTVGPALARLFKELAERQQQRQRSQGRGPLQRSPSPPMTAGPTAAETDVRRRMEAEMRHARDVAAGRAAVEAPPQSPSSWRGAGPDRRGPFVVLEEDDATELARRRRAAMEELRRRQGAPAPARPAAAQPGRAPASVPQAGRRFDQRAPGPARVESTPRRGTSQTTGRSGGSRNRPATRPTIEPVEPSPLSAPSPPPAAASPLRAAVTRAPVALSPAALRQAIIMREILDPPLALRDMT